MGCYIPTISKKPAKCIIFQCSLFLCCFSPPKIIFSPQFSHNQSLPFPNSGLAPRYRFILHFWNFSVVVLASCLWNLQKLGWCKWSLIKVVSLMVPGWILFVCIYTYICWFELDESDVWEPDDCSIGNTIMQLRLLSCFFLIQ